MNIRFLNFLKLIHMLGTVIPVHVHAYGIDHKQDLFPNDESISTIFVYESISLHQTPHHKYDI